MVICGDVIIFSTLKVSNAEVSSAESEQKIYLYCTLSETAYILL
jgi:hypothetical protein